MTTPMLKNYRVIKSNQVCSEKYFLETLMNQGFQGNMPLSIAGTRVRQARHKAGLTQAALAEKLNLDETTISRIENGSQATSFATMLNFSEALDVKFDYLICDYLDDSIHSKDPINAEILDMITPLPDNYKRLIRDNIRQLLEKIPPEMGEK